MSCVFYNNENVFECGTTLMFDGSTITEDALLLLIFIQSVSLVLLWWRR